MSDWILNAQTPAPNDVVVETKIDDKHGIRNQTPLKKQRNLWWFPDGSMYVYYTPTHWRPIMKKEWADLTDSERFSRVLENASLGVELSELRRQLTIEEVPGSIKRSRSWCTCAATKRENDYRLPTRRLHQGCPRGAETGRVDSQPLQHGGSYRVSREPE